MALRHKQTSRGEREHYTGNALCMEEANTRAALQGQRAFIRRVSQHPLLASAFFTPEEAKHRVKVNIYLLIENDVSIEIATMRKLGWRVERPGGALSKKMPHPKSKGISDC